MQECVKERPYLIGIAGSSCSGKTTLCDALATGLPDMFSMGKPLIVHTDDYWTDSKTFPMVHGRKNWELPSCVDFSRLYTVLEKLQTGSAVLAPQVMRKYNCDSNVKEAMLNPTPIILVEGFLLFYDSCIRSLFDRKFFVDVPDEEVVARRLARNRSHLQDKELYYREVVVGEYRKYGLPSKEQADLILDGLLPIERNVQRVLDDILQARL